MAGAILVKRCSCCNEDKPLSKFGRHAACRGAHRGQCTPCRVRKNRKYANTPKKKATQHRYYVANKDKYRKSYIEERKSKLKTRYKISQVDYLAILKAQGGVCAICKTDKPHGRWEKFVIDHCHDTGEVRGILCNQCNRLLAILGDTLDSVADTTERILRYLAGWSEARAVSTPVQR